MHEAGLLDALWHEGRGETRLLVIARVSPTANAGIDDRLARMGLLASIGAQFPRENRHQSVSDRYIDSPEVRELLPTACAMVRVPAFTLVLDQIRSSPMGDDLHRWEVRQRRSSAELTALVDALNAEILATGLPPGQRHSPHVSISYRARAGLARAEAIETVELKIDTIELVVGGGKPYRYTTLGRWPLQPELPRPVQEAMF